MLEILEMLDNQEGPESLETPDIADIQYEPDGREGAREEDSPAESAAPENE